jgi:hypothetical protein
VTKAKRATKRASQLAPAAISVSAAVDPDSGLVTTRVFDGSRQPIKVGTQILLTIRDGAQNQLYRKEVSGPKVVFMLPVHNNFADNYSIVTWSKGYEQVGFQPVKINPNVPQQVDLMLLAQNSDFHFAQARWNDVMAKKPLLSQIFAASVSGDAGAAYDQVMEDHPDHLACLLNITTAMKQIFLPHRTAYSATRTQSWYIRCVWRRSTDNSVWCPQSI